MLLAYFIVCPWEAVAIGKVAVHFHPQFFELYSIGPPRFFRAFSSA